MEEYKSKVYVQVDEKNRITRIEGGYTTPEDLTSWVQIDEGEGDRYNLCQTHYFDGGIYTTDGIPRYKLVDGTPVVRAQEEVDSDRLPRAKAAKIAKSKKDLEAYLASHPLQWTDGEYYSITAEKQSQLSGKMAAVQAAQLLGQPYVMKWNDTGMVCREWSLPDIAALGLAIDTRATALVTYQQTQEIAINSAQTMAELESIEVDYDTVV